MFKGPLAISKDATEPKLHSVSNWKMGGWWNTSKRPGIGSCNPHAACIDGFPSQGFSLPREQLQEFKRPDRQTALGDIADYRWQADWELFWGDSKLLDQQESSAVKTKCWRLSDTQNPNRFGPAPRDHSWFLERVRVNSFPSSNEDIKLSVIK